MIFAARCVLAEQCPLLKGEMCLNDRCATEDDDVCLPASRTAHEKNLRSIPCRVTGSSTSLTLHHARGGSMATNPFGTPGVGQKQNDALQIPLHRDLHLGSFSSRGIDARVGGSVKGWEEENGTQVALLNSTSESLRYSVWMLAWRWASPLVRARVERFLRESPSLFRRP